MIRSNDWDFLICHFEKRKVLSYSREDLKCREEESTERLKKAKNIIIWVRLRCWSEENYPKDFIPKKLTNLILLRLKNVVTSSSRKCYTGRFLLMIQFFIARIKKIFFWISLIRKTRFPIRVEIVCLWTMHRWEYQL